MSERHVEYQVFGKRLSPDMEVRVDQAVQTFRDNHKDPKNLALHAVGTYSIAKGLLRFLRHKRFRGLALIAFGIGMLLAGHEIEGTPAFAFLDRNGQKT